MIIIIISHSFPINSKRNRAESFEVCCQWALFIVQIMTLLLTFTVQKYINFYPPVSKVHAGYGSFRVSVIHRTLLTWTTESLTRGMATPTTNQHNIV